MIFTVNKKTHPYDGLNVHLRALEKTKLTRHKLGFSYADEDLKHADLIILGNFLPEEVYEIRANISKDIKLGYLFCSPFGQASCNGELNILYDLNEMIRANLIDFLFCASREMVDILDHKQIRYLPSVSDFEGMFTSPSIRRNILLIGNNLRVNRNFATQLAGIKFAQELGMTEPIVSWGMDPEAYSFFRKLLNISNWQNFHGFMSDEEKVKLIAGSKLGMQITYSDAFNIAAYEHAMCHVPCLISRSLRWGINEFRVDKIDSAKAIGNQIFHLLSKYPADCTAWRDAAKSIMDENFMECDRTLRHCL
jgi:hypothetical protein